MKKIFVALLMISSLPAFANTAEIHSSSSVKGSSNVPLFYSKEEADQKIAELRAQTKNRADFNNAWWTFVNARVIQVKSDTIANLQSYIRVVLRRTVSEEAPTCNVSNRIGTIDLTCEVKFY